MSVCGKVALGVVVEAAILFVCIFWMGKSRDALEGSKCRKDGVDDVEQ